MNGQTSLSSDSSTFLHGIDSQTENLVFNLPKPSYDEDTQIQKHSNNLEKLKAKINQQRKNKKCLSNEIVVLYDKKMSKEKNTKINKMEENVKVRIENEKSTSNNYLLEKFLSQTTEVVPVQSVENKQKEITFIKPPVPLPRKSKDSTNGASRESSGSDKTYSVSSPQMINKNQDDNISVCSNVTFNIECETENKKVRKDTVYDKSEIVPIGDIVIHNSPPDKKIIKVVGNKNEEIDSENEIVENKKTINDGLEMHLSDYTSECDSDRRNDIENISLDEKTYDVRNSKINKKPNKDVVTEIKLKNTVDTKELPSQKIKTVTKRIKNSVLVRSKNNEDYNEAENSIDLISNFVTSKREPLGKSNLLNEIVETSDDEDRTKQFKKNKNGDGKKKKNQRKKVSTNEKGVKEMANNLVVQDKKESKPKNKTKLKENSDHLNVFNEINDNDRNKLKNIVQENNDLPSKNRTGRKTRKNKRKRNRSNDKKTINKTNECIPEKFEVNKNVVPEIKNISDDESSSLSDSNDKITISKEPVDIKTTSNTTKQSNVAITKNSITTTNSKDNETSSNDNTYSDIINELKNKLQKINKNKNKSTTDTDSDELNATVLNDKDSKKSNTTKKTVETIELKDFTNKNTNKLIKSKKKEITVDDSNSLRFEYNYEYLLGIVVYKTDYLLLNSFITHPIVKIHIVDSKTGEYLKKSKNNTLDNDDAGIEEYLSPKITKAFNLQEKRSLIPFWEEMITFDEDFDYFINFTNCIIFFEILDFLTFQTASLKHKSEGINSGWYKVAWAFLKPVSKNGILNIETKTRLQLYKPKKYVKSNSVRKCGLFDWWNGGKLLKYPSTLYVNIKKVKSVQSKQNQIKEQNIKSELLLKINETNSIKSVSTEIIENCSNDGCKENGRKRIWSRINTQSCKVPNKILGRLKTGSKGCVKMKFSNNGLYLACGSINERNCKIIIYDVTFDEEFVTLSRHNGLIYDLNWSSNDKYLLSASADRTVYIWKISKITNTPIQIIPHPSFVYCAIFSNVTTEIITGCYDSVIRVWKSNGDINSNYELLQELEDHNGYITSICSLNNKKVFYSSDSIGIVNEWCFNDEEWVLNRTFKFREIKNIIINCLILHPGGKRLLLCCRDSVHRMVDISVGCIIQWYRGSLNYRLQLTACITPCGSLVIAPSEDGMICVWDVDTGILHATFTSYPYPTNETVISHCTQYHPYDHMLAVSHHGVNVSIFICVYEKNFTDSDNFILKDLTIQGTGDERPLKNEKKKRSLRNAKNVVTSKTGGKNVNLETIIEKLDEVLGSARNEN